MEKLIIIMVLQGIQIRWNDICFHRFKWIEYRFGITSDLLIM